MSTIQSAMTNSSSPGAPPEEKDIPQAQVVLSSGKSDSLRLTAIDGMRALAIIMVYTYHVWEFGDSAPLNVNILKMHFSFGKEIAYFPGPIIFMVLSGFCLFFPLTKPNGVARWKMDDYFKRRFRRIVPPYYVAMFLLILLPHLLVILTRALGKDSHSQAWPEWWQIGSHLLFIHTWFPQTWDGIQGAFWSLGVEMQFYLVFPLVIWLYRRTNILSTVGAMAALSAVYLVISGILTVHQPWVVRFLLSITFLGCWIQFAAGMYVAWLVSRQLREREPLSAMAGNLLILGSASLYILAKLEIVQRIYELTYFPLQNLMFCGMAGMFIFAVCASRTPLRKIVDNRWMAALGLISYSVYLLHQNFAYYIGELMKKFLHLGGEARFAFLMTGGFILIVCLARGFFHFVERPCMNSIKNSTKSGALPKTRVA